MVFLHMENGRVSDSLYKIGNDTVLMKLDCRSNSRLSTTQKNHRIRHHTTPLDQQMRMLDKNMKNISILCLFSAKKTNPPNLVDRGFCHHGTLDLIENIHTRRSFNNSTEYCHLYSKKTSSTRAAILYDKWNEHLRRISQNPRELFDRSVFLETVHLHASQTLTTHQRTIWEAYRKRRDSNTPFYFNAGCSLQFALFAGPHQDAFVRKENGKLGAMSTPIVSWRDRAYKLQPSGCFLLRGIRPPEDCNKRGQSTRMRNIARHMVHPEFIDMLCRMYRLC